MFVYKNFDDFYPIWNKHYILFVGLKIAETGHKEGIESLIELDEGFETFGLIF